VTLSEAITHTREKAQEDTFCAQDHQQLAEWLTELQARRARDLPLLRLGPEEMRDRLATLEVMLADGFEDALIGYVERFGMEPVALYDRDMCIHILMTRDGMSYEGAVETFDFNTAGAWVGEKTPAFATLTGR